MNILYFIAATVFEIVQSRTESRTIFSVSLEHFPLRNIAFDLESNDCFVSGKNVLFRFNVESFQEVVTKETGPNLDCLPDLNEDEKQRFCGDDENSVMIVTSSGLITCSTLYGGLCVKRDKAILNATSTNTSIGLVSNIDMSAVGILSRINVTDSTGSRHKEIILFAKTDTKLPTDALSLISKSVIFSTDIDLIRKPFSTSLLNEDGVFDFFVKKSLASSVRLDYKSALQNDDFIFLLVNQNNKGKLVKICKNIHKDDPKRAYEDIPLSCTDADSIFNVVQHGDIFVVNGTRYLVIAFSNKTGFSVVCVYSEEEIYNAFLESRKDRFACPGVNLSDEYQIFDVRLTNSVDCVNTSLSKSDIHANYPQGIYSAVTKGAYCNNVTLTEYGVIIGMTAMSGSAVYRTTRHISVVGIEVYNNLTTLYIGTKDGDVVKVYYDPSDSTAREMDVVSVDHNDIRAIRYFNQTVYAMSGSKVVMFVDPECEDFETCEKCMLVKNARCGWCVNTHSCVSMSVCSNNGELWLPSVKNQCLKIFPYTFAAKLSNVNQKVPISINFEPQLLLSGSNNLSCYLNNSRLTCALNGHSLVCYMEIGYSTSPGNADLSVKLGEKKIAETKFLIYNCSIFRTCKECLKGDVTDCFWCSHAAVCVISVGSCAHYYMFYIRRDENKCPHVQAQTLYIPNGRKRDISFKALNLPNISAVSHFKYKCVIDGEDFIGNISQHSFICKDVELSYNEDRDHIKKRISFFYGPSASVELEPITGDTHITVYKCEYLSSDKTDCSSCHYFNQTQLYECHWCEATGCVDMETSLCTVADTCPHPLFNQIEPLDGPIGGGTIVNITGTNLYNENTQIKSILIAGVPCTDIKFLKRKISCVTKAVTSSKTGNVEIIAETQLNYTKTVLFNYKNPEVTDIIPNQSIKSGGRKVTIRGRDIITGNKNVNVALIPKSNSTTQMSSECIVILEESVNGEIVCRTTRAVVTGLHKLKVTFDGNTERYLTGKYFEYLDDPSITETEPPRDKLRSIYSGGLNFFVIGKGFSDVIENLVISFSDSDKAGTFCSMLSEVLLLCQFPGLQQHTVNRRHKRDISTRAIVIHLDGFSFVISNSVIYISDPVIYAINSNSTLLYDPASEPDHIVIKDIICGDVDLDKPWPQRIMIYGYTDFNKPRATFNTGEELSLITKREDYLVQIGSGECYISELTESNLTCKPPAKEPSPKHGEDKLYVRVALGNVKTVVGVLQYKEETKDSTLYVVIGALIFITALIGLIIVILKYRQKQKTTNDDIYLGSLPSTDKRNTEDYASLNAEGKGSIPLHVNHDLMLILKDKHLLINKDALSMGDVIGRGNFGMVYKGVMSNVNTNNHTDVAVKTLHLQNPRDIDIDQFIDEALRMSDFDHPNVMTLIGICLEMDEMPVVILPFMKHGDLLTYIRNGNNDMTTKDLMTFGLDISRGMSYLSKMKVVHRDLAARNCMLTERNHAVVADFGLSRDIYEKDYYSITNKKAKLPVKWMAPESLEKGIYDSQSDVWSFGVVLWELFTRGNKPYPEVDSWDILKYLKQSRRLPQPRVCPDQIDEVLQYIIFMMKECGIPDVPSLSNVKQFVPGDLKIENMLQKNTDTDGNVSWMIKPTELVKLNLANPITSKLITRYPSVSSDASPAGTKRWKSLKFHWARSSNGTDFYMGNLITFNVDGQEVHGRITQFLEDKETQKKFAEADVFFNNNHPYVLSVANHPKEKCLIRMNYSYTAPLSDCKIGLGVDTENHLIYDYKSGSFILMNKEMTDSILSDHYSAHTKWSGKPVIKVPLNIFIDDLSANKSRRWAPMHAAQMKISGLSTTEKNQSNNTLFLSASEKMSMMELISPICDNIQESKEMGVDAFDALLMEPVKVTLDVALLTTDYHMMSLACNHCGPSAKKFCPKCYVDDADPLHTGNARTKNLTLRTINRMQLMKNSSTLQKQTGVKVYSNPLWKLIDPHRDSPIGILHFLYLGLAKHLIQFCYDKLSADQREILKLHLESIDQQKFSYKINADTFFRYIDSRQGKDFKHYLQLAPFNFTYAGLQSKYTDALSKLALLSKHIQQERCDVDVLSSETDAYLQFVKEHIPELGRKKKTHLCTHLAEDMKNHGHPHHYTEDSFEKNHGIIRTGLFHQNGQAKSRDSAMQFTRCEVATHIIRGGFIPVNDNWLQAETEVLKMGKEKNILTFLGQPCDDTKQNRPVGHLMNMLRKENGKPKKSPNMFTDVEILQGVISCGGDPLIINDSTKFFYYNSAMMENGEIVDVGEFVVYKTENQLFIGRLIKLIGVQSRSHPNYFIAKLSETTCTKDKDTEYIEETTGTLFVPTRDLQQAIHAIHDCIRGHCILKEGNIEEKTEQEIVLKQKKFIKHNKNHKKYMINKYRLTLSFDVFTGKDN